MMMILVRLKFPNHDGASKAWNQIGPLTDLELVLYMSSNEERVRNSNGNEEGSTPLPFSWSSLGTWGGVGRLRFDLAQPISDEKKGNSAWAWDGFPAIIGCCS
jgi:hypothetical protein